VKFAKIVFNLAGIWGVVTVFPVYFLENYVGHHSPPAIPHPEFFYGFVGVTLTWQLVFLTIAKNPIRFRAFIPLAALEKASYLLAIGALLATHRISPAVAVPSLSDLTWFLLFVAAYFKTPESSDAV
jgi:hypothetical protein